MATYMRTQSIEHTTGESGLLTLKITAGEISVRGVPGDQVRITANFEIRAASEEEADQAFQEAELRVQRGDGALTVEEPDRHASLGALVGRLFARGMVGLSLSVELPERAELRLDVVSADANVEGLLGEQRYNTVSGDLSLTRAGGSIRANGVSGDITVRAEQPIDVRAETVSGDLTVVAPTIRGLRANAVSGDVDVEGQLTAGREYRIDTVSGDASVGLLGGATFEVRGISSDVVSNLDHRIEGPRDRRRVVVGDGGPDVIFNSMSGDLAIRRPRRLDRMAPAPPKPPAPPVSPARPSTQLPAEDQLAILQALERGEIDVEEATRRLGGHSGE
jgi:putative adhesin